MITLIIVGCSLSYVVFIVCFALVLGTMGPNK